MAKVYEALERAQQELIARRDEELPASDAARIPLTYSEEDGDAIMVNLYQSIVGLLPETEKMVIQFAGSAKGEGTSTVLRQFAQTVCSKVGKRVLILDADCVNPGQHHFFCVRPGRELEKVTRTNGGVDEAVRRIANSNLYLGLVSGDSDSQLQFFNSPGIDSLWDKLKAMFDLILIDSPPINGCSDGLAICRSVDGVVMIVESEKTRWPVALRAKERLTQSGGKVLGVVLNKRKFHIPRFIYDRV